MHATEMKTKRHYTAPVTQRATVELEGGFCGSIYETKSIEAKGHEVGGEYSFDGTGKGDLNGSDAAGGEFSVSWQ